MNIQELIDSGQAWLLEGSVGRACMDAIEAGHAMLGEERRTDYWGNRVPSRMDVVPGTKGSKEYMEQHLDNCECVWYNEGPFEGEDE